jgi:hypothetical protein
MGKEINIVVGCKGGVGKTQVAKALVNLHVENGQDVIVIDGDMGNPGLYKTYQSSSHAKKGGRVVVATLNLADAEAWSTLVNMCEDMPHHAVVMDTPAGSHESFRRYGEILHECLKVLDRTWTSYFVLNGQRDSAELLRDYLEMTPESHVVHAALNTFFGEARAFERFAKSETKLKLEARGGMSFYFPELAGHVVSEIDWDRMSYDIALKQLPLGHKILLSKWLQHVRRAFEAPLRTAQFRLPDLERHAECTA